VVFILLCPLGFGFMGEAVYEIFSLGFNWKSRIPAVSSKGFWNSSPPPITPLSVLALPSALPPI